MSVERGKLEIKLLKRYILVINEDPASLKVGSRRRFNQPKLKSKTIISQRLLQG